MPLGIAEYQQPANVVGNIGISAPVPSDAHAPAVGDFFALMGGLNSAGTWDQWRSNQQGVLLALAARTAGLSTAIMTNFNAKGVIITVKMTAWGGAGSIRINIQGYSKNGNAYSLNANPAVINANGTYVYELYPGIGAASGDLYQRTSGSLPERWYVYVTHADGTSHTYSVEYDMIL